MRHYSGEGASNRVPFGHILDEFEDLESFRYNVELYYSAIGTDSDNEFVVGFRREIVRPCWFGDSFEPSDGAW